MRAMLGIKLIDRKNTKELMQILGITVLIERTLRAAAVRWCGHVLRREEDDILKEAMGFEVIEKRKKR